MIRSRAIVMVTSLFLSWLLFLHFTSCSTLVPPRFPTTSVPQPSFQFSTGCHGSHRTWSTSSFLCYPFAGLWEEDWVTLSPKSFSMTFVIFSPVSFHSPWLWLSANLLEGGPSLLVGNHCVLVYSQLFCCYQLHSVYVQWIQFQRYEGWEFLCCSHLQNTDFLHK